MHIKLLSRTTKDRSLLLTYQLLVFIWNASGGHLHLSKWHAPQKSKLTSLWKIGLILSPTGLLNYEADTNCDW